MKSLFFVLLIAVPLSAADLISEINDLKTTRDEALQLCPVEEDGTWETTCLNNISDTFESDLKEIHEENSEEEIHEQTKEGVTSNE